MQLISHYEVPSGGVSSITFMAVGDIPTDYTDLVMLVSGRATHSDVNAALTIAFNSSSSNFTMRSVVGTGSSVASGTGTTSIGSINGATSTSNTFSSTQVYIPNYRSSANKSLSTDAVTENNATAVRTSIHASLWSVTDPITSITLECEGDFVEYSSASLYGVLAGSDGIVAVS